MSAGSCPESDALVDLCGALEWKAGEFLDHLVGCDECREQIGRLEDLHGILDETCDLASDFATEVMGSLKGVRKRVTAAAVLTPVLAGFTAFAALVAASAGRGPPHASDALLALGVGLGTVLWNRLDVGAYY